MKEVDKTYLKAQDIMELLDIGQAYAYQLIKQLNQELNDKGFLTIRGKVNKNYFKERFYFGDQSDE